MASAAAVAANAAESPIPDNLGNENVGISGTITSTGKGPASDKDSVEDDDEDEEDDIVPAGRRKPGGGVKNDTSDKDDDDDLAIDDNAPGAGDDLFGSDGGDDQELENEEDGKKHRTLDDSGLDSGDDENRNDRAVEDAGEAPPVNNFEEINQLRAEVEACAMPEPGDDEIYLMKVPKFLSFQPDPFDQSTFEPPKFPHHSTQTEEGFSARKTAFTTLRYRHNPTDPSKLDSNARILRWSDGSLTLQLATEPETQYPLSAQNLAPQLYSATKPTPTSARPSHAAKTNGEAAAPYRPYNPNNDSFTYLSHFSRNAGLIKMTNKITAAIKVEATRDVESTSRARFKAKFAQVREKGAGEVTFKPTTEDPERAAKERELAWKEEEKIKKRQQRQEEKKEEGAPVRQMIGRKSGPGGLSAAGLEGEDEGGKATYKRKRTMSGRTSKARRSRAKRARRTGEIFSDEEEEFGRRIRTREDEYDEEDDFVAPSDEEEELEEDDEDEEEEPDAEGDEDDESAPPPPRRASSGLKRRRESTAKGRTGRGADDEADAEGDPDPEAGGTSGPPPSSAPGRSGSPQTGRTTKRRRIVDDDDEDD